MENNEELQELNKSESKRLSLVNTLKETTRIAGEFKINEKVLKDERLSPILIKGYKALDEFNKEIMEYLIAE